MLIRWVKRITATNTPDAKAPVAVLASAFQLRSKKKPIGR
jgi:hypothetical protein